MKTIKIAATAMTLLILAAPCFGQDKTSRRSSVDNYLVSARAGGVNLVQGDVTYKGSKTEWDMLIAGDELNDGDIVKTGNNGRLELLLNPGSYLRVSRDAELVLTNTSLDELNVALKRGSFILEAAAVGAWTGTLVTLTTPTTTYRVAQGGLYRFNVDSTGRSEALVFKGKLIAGDRMVKNGRKVAGDVASAEPVSFDKKLQDEFDLWSKDRAKVLIAANEQLPRRSLMNRGLGFFGNSWFFSSTLGCYTFLPGFYGYSSPYGGGYGVCNPFGGYYYPSGPNPSTGGGSTGTVTRGSGNWGSSGSSSGTITRSNPPSPPSSSPSAGRSSGSSSGGGWRAPSGGGGTISRPAPSVPAPSSPRGRP